MKLKDQVCSLEKSERLKELGVSGSGHFGYSFTVAELGRMLNVDVKGVLPNEYNLREISQWFELNDKKYNTEAQLRAGILIFALDLGFLDVKECNKRLIK